MIFVSQALVGSTFRGIFVFQPNKWVDAIKRQIKSLQIPISTYTDSFELPCLTFVGSFIMVWVVIIAMSHYFIDAIKVNTAKSLILRE